MNNTKKRKYIFPNKIYDCYQCKSSNLSPESDGLIIYQKSPLRAEVTCKVCSFQWQVCISCNYRFSFQNCSRANKHFMIHHSSLNLRNNHQLEENNNNVQAMDVMENSFDLSPSEDMGNMSSTIRSISRTKPASLEDSCLDKKSVSFFQSEIKHGINGGVMSLVANAFLVLNQML